MRFIDRIIAEWDAKGSGGLATRLSNAVKVNVQNVADYIFENNAQAYAIAREIPTAAPPWAMFYKEWRMPEKFRGEDGTVKSTPSFLVGMNFGALFIAREVDLLATKNKRCVWLLQASLFVDFRANIPIVTTILPLDDMGVPVYLPRSDEARAALTEIAGSAEDSDWGEDGWMRGVSTNGVYADEVEPLLAIHDVQLQVPVFAISLCHCKNVTRKETRTGVQSLPKKHRDRFPDDRWYVLEIDPMKTALAQAGADGSPGSFQRALHICRGHFATYRPENPLFGKFTGTFWRPMHARGSATHGSVGKDYLIKSPR